MRAIICGGGTVGHIAPAVAIADEILKNEKDSEILFIGRENGEENNLILKRKYTLKTIKISGLNRKNFLKNIKIPYLLFNAYKKAKAIIKEFKPDIVIGTGGYVCLPVIKAASRLKIKSVIHESNAVLGLATRLLFKNCVNIFVNIPINNNRIQNNDKIIQVGTPVLEDFEGISRKNARLSLGIKDNEILILSFGGSGGAEILNECMLGLCENKPNFKRRVIHIHATGRKYYNEALKGKIKEDAAYKLKFMPYIEDMPKYMKAADIVICRAGAITIAELATIGVASILIPSPNVADNHQFKNAEVLEKDNAAILINESQLTPKLLEQTTRELISSEKKLDTLRKNITKFSSKNAAKKIYSAIKKIIAK